MAKTIAEAKCRVLKQQIHALGWVRPGSVIRRYMRCGNPSCRCVAKPARLHGPYYQWSHKICGRTVSLRLSEGQVRLCREWAGNHKKLRKLLRRLEALALRETDRMLGAISRT
jgi:hypothetical protein